MNKEITVKELVKMVHEDLPDDVDINLTYNKCGFYTVMQSWGQSGELASDNMYVYTYIGPPGDKSKGWNDVENESRAFSDDISRLPAWVFIEAGLLDGEYRRKFRELSYPL